jgi:tmRNA-binding protein
MFDEFEAGIVLRGSEVKSLRKGHTNFTEAYDVAWHKQLRTARCSALTVETSFLLFVCYDTTVL